jgi:hypothetical protein
MNNLVLSLTSSAAAGALTLISPTGWSSRVRAAYVVVPGVLVAAAGAWSLSRNTGEKESVDVGTEPASQTGEVPVSAQRLPVAARAAMLLGLGAATCGVQAASLRIDAALERWLVGRGSTHPRRWMAALAVLASLGMDAAGDRVRTLAGEDRRPSS